MKRTFVVFAILIAAVLFPLAALYSLLPSLVKAGPVQKQIIQQIQEMTENSFTFSRSTVSYFPSLKIEFYDPSLNVNGQEKSHFQAKKIKINFSLLKLVFGKLKISSLKVQEGQAIVSSLFGMPVKEFQLDNLRFELKPVTEASPMKFSFQSNVAGISKALSGQGTLTSSFKKWDWNSVSVEGKIRLRDLNLAFLGDWDSSLKIEQEKLNGQLEFRKKKQEPSLELVGQTKLRDLGLDFNLTWNPDSKEFLIKTSRLSSPIGKVEAGGRGVLGGKIQDVRFRASEVALEGIPQYWTSLKKWIPNNFGFSGQSNFEISLQGTWNDLACHATLDLSPAILTYAHYFSKPKDLPLSLTFDFLLKDRKTLAGDFSMRFQDATVKGTLAHYNFENGDGQLNVITNKFQLKGWESLLLPFQNYELEGEMKLLANWKGNFNKVQDLKSMANLTLEKVHLARKNGPAIDNLNLNLDYGALGLIIKGAQFQIANSPVEAELTVYNISDLPIINAKVKSSHLEPQPFLTAFHDWASEWLSPQIESLFEHSQIFLTDIFPEGESIDNFNSEFQYHDKKWSIDHLKFETYGGDATLQGQLDLNPQVPTYTGDLEMNKISLARFLRRGKREEGTFEGNFFLKTRLQGQKPPQGNWLDSLAGDGAFMVTNGAFKSFDLLGTIAKISEFKEIARAASGTTPFEDIHSRFFLKEKKVVTEKLTLISPDFSLEGKGDMGLEGVLNYRLNVFLSPFLTKQLMQSVVGEAALEKNKQLGPIPLLLSGPLGKPEVQPDPEQVPQFLEQFSKKKSQKILTNFLPEEIFFERRANS